VKSRTKELSTFFQSYSPYQHRIGEVYRVLVTETSHDNNYFVGHNEFYEQVLVPKLPELMGKMFQVRIVNTCRFSMTGELLESTEVVRPAPSDPLAPGQVSGLIQETSARLSSSSNYFTACILVLGLAILVRVLQIITNQL